MTEQNKITQNRTEHHSTAQHSTEQYLRRLAAITYSLILIFSSAPLTSVEAPLKNADAEPLSLSRLPGAVQHTAVQCTRIYMYVYMDAYMNNA